MKTRHFVLTFYRKRVDFTLSWETEKNQGSLKLKLMEAFRNFCYLKMFQPESAFHNNDIVPSQEPTQFKTDASN